MFKRLPEVAAAGAVVGVSIDGVPAQVPAGISVAAAVLANYAGPTRTTPVSGAARAPYCMMGVCFECQMEIDGVASRQACLVEVAEGMRIVSQRGRREAL
jgi:hypothetical protein